MEIGKVPWELFMIPCIYGVLDHASTNRELTEITKNILFVCAKVIFFHCLKYMLLKVGMFVIQKPIINISKY